MPLDALCLSALTGELSERIADARIEKIQQPERDVLVLTLGRQQGGNVKLLLCAGTGSARLHITEQTFENPAAPPMFCMLLRKHLQGGRIIELAQPLRERVVTLRIGASDALGDYREEHLVLELMNTPNLILTGEDGIIIECLRRVGGAESGKRPVLPGLRYRLPETPEKLDIISGDLSQLLQNNGIPADKQLLDKFFGLSPLIARETAHRAQRCGSITAAVEELRRKYSSGDFVPTLLRRNGEPFDFSFMEIAQYGAAVTAERRESFSALLDNFYAERSRDEHMRARSSAIMKTVKNALQRARRKMAAQKNELLDTAKKERLRECGDLLTANLYSIKEGDRTARVEDYYNGNAPREIALDPLKTPQQNAAKYYKDYKRAKNAERFLTEQIEIGEREIRYLESVVEELERAEGEHALEEIRAELIAEGLLKSKDVKKAGNRPNKKPKTQKAASPLVFTSQAGLTVRVGRNNMQNERLVLHESSKTDLWLHVQKRHGSHVVISCAGLDPDDRSVEEAAALAAYYSEARDDSKTPVDYCLVKHVKKQPGGRTGMVIYTDYKTIIVSPKKEI